MNAALTISATTPQEDRATTTTEPTSKLAPTETRALQMARVAAETRAHHIVVMDLRTTVDWVDYMIVATGTSRRQMKAVADRIEEAMEAMGDRKLSRSESDQWIALDFGDIILHLFDEQGREYYQLDHYWGEAPRLVWEDPEHPVAVASAEDIPDSEDGTRPAPGSAGEDDDLTAEAYLDEGDADPDDAEEMADMEDFDDHDLESENDYDEDDDADAAPAGR